MPELRVLKDLKTKLFSLLFIPSYMSKFQRRIKLLKLGWVKTWTLHWGPSQWPKLISLACEFSTHLTSKNTLKPCSYHNCHVIHAKFSRGNDENLRSEAKPRVLRGCFYSTEACVPSYTDLILPAVGDLKFIALREIIRPCLLNLCFHTSSSKVESNTPFSRLFGD